jgi:hypothetical protein
MNYIECLVGVAQCNNQVACPTLNGNLNKQVACSTIIVA